MPFLLPCTEQSFDLVIADDQHLLRPEHQRHRIIDPALRRFVDDDEVEALLGAGQQKRHSLLPDHPDRERVIELLPELVKSIKQASVMSAGQR